LLGPGPRKVRAVGCRTREPGPAVRPSYGSASQAGADDRLLDPKDRWVGREPGTNPRSVPRRNIHAGPHATAGCRYCSGCSVVRAAVKRLISCTNSASGLDGVPARALPRRPVRGLPAGPGRCGPPRARPRAAPATQAGSHLDASGAYATTLWTEPSGARTDQRTVPHRPRERSLSGVGRLRLTKPRRWSSSGG